MFAHERFDPRVIIDATCSDSHLICVLKQIVQSGGPEGTAPESFCPLDPNAS